MAKGAARKRRASKGGPLGMSANYRWWASAREIDMAMPARPPVALRLPTAPQAITIDLRRTAIIVVDMQNDFCAKGGWVDQIGADYTAGRGPIKPLRALLPALRKAQVPVIWLNWGNRPDRMNNPPPTLHIFKPTGVGFGIGDPLPGSRAAVLTKDSWAAAVVDELKQKPGDIKVDKYRISGFWDTPLDSILRNLGVKTIMFTGVNTDQCVLHSLADANFLGYGCILVEDCCATTSPEYCTTSTIWNVQRCFGFVTDSKTIVGALKGSTRAARAR
jgi:nicotinamidase-related amidase